MSKANPDRSSDMRGTVSAMLIAIAACSGQSKKPAARADTLTTRQRDSAIGASSIPGASGVTKAMNAADSGAARAARIDSTGAAIQ
jgi:hypothetical protein